LIEFPSILLPPGATTGSIVNIAVHQNVGEEKRRDAEFWGLQNDILEMYGVTAPQNPKLEVSSILFTGSCNDTIGIHTYRWCSYGTSHKRP
jgi:chitin biosynthesis protein CHS5